MNDRPHQSDFNVDLLVAAAAGTSSRSHSRRVAGDAAARQRLAAQTHGPKQWKLGYNVKILIWVLLATFGGLRRASKRKKTAT